MGGKLFLLPAVGDGVFLPNQDEETFMSLFSVSKGLSTCNISIWNWAWLIVASPPPSFTHLQPYSYNTQDMPGMCNELRYLEATARLPRAPDLKGYHMSDCGDSQRSQESCLSGLHISPKQGRKSPKMSPMWAKSKKSVQCFSFDWIILLFKHESNVQCSKGDGRAEIQALKYSTSLEPQHPLLGRWGLSFTWRQGSKGKPHPYPLFTA